MMTDTSKEVKDMKDKAKGKANETAGKVRDDKSQELKGKGQSFGADLKNDARHLGDDLKSEGKKLKDKFNKQKED
ncbi:CsbD family protein [Enterococcus sp. AZ109]|uniref:CsbD family protein n=1 Tax=Enterococcus sp. AZ109 TaxID=2774634 RepID=UPI003F298B6A